MELLICNFRFEAMRISKLKTSEIKDLFNLVDKFDYFINPTFFNRFHKVNLKFSKLIKDNYL